MDILTIAALSGLNPEIEKIDLINQNDNYFNNTNEEFLDLKKTYFFVNNYEYKLDLIKKYIESFALNNSYEVNLSLNTINNSTKFLDNLSSSIVDQIDLKSIYTSSYGTIVFDIEKSNSEIFSLEIGKKEFGYFIEKKGVDIKQVDALKIDELNKDLLTDLNKFFE
ncbi:hypothetical protein [Polaribacter porphyrae]|uniref:Uncharacterized protein n=1 Tax=Polaribacter porphyrae TaxID=1137780 RepID=A0A2S7WRU8_9FLAO|nr:hypothetical protein [Polaribacter porphyrae]PQJ80320.1 hypothetical protein BTO18_14555 [Polaribacter porphyrae]